MRVYVPERHDGSWLCRLLLGSAALRIVEVGGAVMGVDHVVAAPCGRKGMRRVAPGHHGEVVGQLGAGLGPADRPASVPGQERSDAAQEPPVQCGRTTQPRGAGARPGFRALLPFGGGALVATDVDVRGGEDVHDLLQHGAAEVEDLLVDPEDGVADSPPGPHVQHPVGTVAQVRIRGQGGTDVAGHFDLGQHGDASGSRVPHQVGQLGAGVGAAVRHTVVVVAAGTGHGLGTMGADLGELGVGRDRHPPPLVVGQMQMEDIDLVQGQEIDVTAQVGHRLEVAGHVEHRSAPAVPGDVRDLHTGQ